MGRQVNGRAKRPYTPRSPQPRTCQECRADYLTTANNSRYCGSRCKERARYTKDREKRLAAQRGWREQNAEAISERARARRLADPEKYRAQSRASYARNREARIRDAVRYQRENPQVVALTRNRRRTARHLTVTGRDLRRLLNRHGGRCAYCNVCLDEWGRSLPTSLQWDHVVPLSLGGRHSVGNLLPSCRSCNMQKGARFAADFKYRTIGLREKETNV